MCIINVLKDEINVQAESGNGFTVILKADGTAQKGKIVKLFGFKDLGRVEIQEAFAGDIVGIAGFSDIQIGETISCLTNPVALPLIKVDEPTLQMNFSINDSPFAGTEGKFVTSRQLRKRLYLELEKNWVMVLKI